MLFLFKIWISNYKSYRPLFTQGKSVEMTWVNVFNMFFKGKPALVQQLARVITVKSG